MFVLGFVSAVLCFEDPKRKKKMGNVQNFVGNTNKMRQRGHGKRLAKKV